MRISVLFSISVFLLTSSFLEGQVIVFENDQLGWQAAVNNDPTIIDFESVEGSTVNPINGDEFNAFLGGPVLSLVAGDGLFVGNPAPGQIPNPPSGVNMLGPAGFGSIEGIIRITFDTPVRALGATFVDVEGDFLSTGLSIDTTQSLPDMHFSAAQGQGTFAFFGFVSETAFNAVDIHFATGTNIDGTLIDDLTYGLVEPNSIEDQVSSTLQIHVFPNPCQDLLTFDFDRMEEATTSVYDLSGALVISPARSNSGSLDVSHLDTGEYLLSIKHSNGQTSQRLFQKD